MISDAAIEGASVTAPAFGSNVVIFSPSMSMTTIQSQLDTIYAQQLNNQFGTNRYTFLFLPGKYTLDVGVAYYMQVLGLGHVCPTMSSLQVRSNRRASISVAEVATPR